MKIKLLQKTFFASCFMLGMYCLTTCPVCHPSVEQDNKQELVQTNETETILFAHKGRDAKTSDANIDIKEKKVVKSKVRKKKSKA